MPCYKDRFQPFDFSTEKTTSCIYLKSKCSEEGQYTIINNTSHSTTADTTCGCKQGFSFISSTNIKSCSCIPFIEDCTCFKKRITGEDIHGHCPSSPNGDQRDKEHDILIKERLTRDGSVINFSNKKAGIAVLVLLYIMIAIFVSAMIIPEEAIHIFVARFYVNERTANLETATTYLNEKADCSNIEEENKETFNLMNEATASKCSEELYNESIEVYNSCLDLLNSPRAQGIESNGTNKMDDNESDENDEFEDAREEQGNESSETHNLARTFYEAEPSEDHEFNIDNLNNSQVDILESLHGSKVEAVDNFDGSQNESLNTSCESLLAAVGNSCDGQPISIDSSNDGPVEVVDIKDGCQIKAEHVSTSSQDEDHAFSGQDKEEEEVGKSQDQENKGKKS